MDREKAIDLLDNLIGMVEDNQESDYDTALKMGIQALSQEPCEELISREAVQKEINCWIGSGEYRYAMSERFLIDRINNLPSVTQKSGKWIDYRDDGFVECPFCGHATNCEDDIDELHYCFYCGARMVEPQESEE